MSASVPSTPTKAFIIGPIGDKDADDNSPARVAYEEGIQLFEEVIAPACIGYGLEATRADMISRPGEIPEQIFRQLRDCPVVIADLTGANPNVMYELGLRHTTGKVTVQLGEKDRLPFDVAAIRTIMFKRTAAGLVQARKELSKALATTLDSGGDPVTATRIWFEAPGTDAGSGTSPTDKSSGESEDDEQPGYLELLAEAETSMQSLGQAMTSAASIIEDISDIYADGTKRVRQADDRGAGAGARLVIAEQVAGSLANQAAKFEVVSGEIAHTVERIEPGLRYLFDRLAEDPQQLAESASFPGHVEALCAAAGGSIDNVLKMKATVLEIGKASRSLKRVGQRLAPSFDRFVKAARRIAEWQGFVDRIQPQPEPSSS